MRYSAQEKLKAVKAVVVQGKSLSSVSKKLGTSRQALYLWIVKYRQDPKKAARSLINSYKRGKSHHKRLGYKVEKQILDLVVKYPSLSLSGFSGRLSEAKINVSKHGIYNVLVRNGLQTKQLRQSFSLAHSTRTVLASAIAPAARAQAVEEHLIGKKPIAQICKIWGISRPTFYDWLGRYKEVQSSKFKVTSESALVGAMVRRYKKGYENHRSVSRKVVETVLDIVRANPAYSVHKIYAQIPKVAGRVIVGHHGIQNILSRENLSTFAKRLIFAGGFAPEPRVQVAPLYRPQIPVYRFGMLLALFKMLPRAVIKSPRNGLARLGLTIIPFVVVGLWMRMLIGTSGVSPVGLLFASFALFFGLFFFIYSLKYYVSILMVLKLAQGGASAKS